MTATKLLTGQDAPLTNLEMALTHTYQLAKKRFEQQQRTHSKGKRR